MNFFEVLALLCMHLFSQFAQGAPVLGGNDEIQEQPKRDLVFLIPALAILAVFLAIFVTKWIYVVRRRKHTGRNRERADLESGWYDSNTSGSSSHQATPLVSSKKAKSGFWIGLLGSPTWETRYSAIISGVSGQLSLAQSGSLSSRKSGCPSSSSNNSRQSKGYANLDLPSNNSPSEKEEKKTPTSVAIQVFRELTFPSPAITFTRSPPTAEWQKAQPAATKTSPPGSAKANIKHPAPALISKSSIPVSSPGLDAFVTASRFNLSSSAHMYPFSTPHLSSAASPELKETSNSQPVTIPTYYGLFNTTLSSLPSRKNNISLAAQTPKKHPTGSFSLGAVAARSSQQSLCSNLESPSPMSSTLSPPPLTESVLRSPPLGPHASEPHPLKPYKPRQKTTAGTRRTRFSPKLGPSPLRKTILPSKSSTDSLSNQLPKTPTKQRASSSKRTSVSSISPSSPTPSSPTPSEGSSNSPSFLETPTRKPKSADNDSLLELMAELVEESSAWDPSVFVDSNFKALLSTTAGMPTSPPPPQTSTPPTKTKQKSVDRQSWRKSRLARWSKRITILEDIPEVDVTEMAPLESTGDTFPQSFWADEDDDCQMLIGLAH